jgi:hypothetical protein
MRLLSFVFNARPHPNPLPRGEGTNGDVFVNFRSVNCSYPLTESQVTAYDSSSPGGRGPG